MRIAEEECRARIYSPGAEESGINTPTQSNSPRSSTSSEVRDFTFEGGAKTAEDVAPSQSASSPTTSSSGTVASPDSSSASLSQHSELSSSQTTPVSSTSGSPGIQQPASAASRPPRAISMLPTRAISLAAKARASSAPAMPSPLRMTLPTSSSTPATPAPQRSTSFWATRARPGSASAGSRRSTSRGWSR